ncbi:hypothetical protein [Salidesulfovibrio brasiliensis]|uniref:hypothetical protein n=1 Tax=Salidesulfovibrio brasiliensis TaxID=221711 RepID=UPI0006CF90F4|nr:hypothetical protein [Salidesulfovibrio brasiliensis]
MNTSTFILIFFTVSELALLGVVILFFIRLKKSEALLSKLQAKQEDFINRLQFNAKLESELVATFEQRQMELASLNEELEARSNTIKELINRADEYAKSPQFMRNVILAGHKAGKTPADLARKFGLSIEEVELIIGQA